jgi:hypothetical protein
MNNGNMLVQVVATKTNVLALWGFWLAVGSFFTCGATALPAFLCSLVGVREEPKGWAMAGLFVSAPGVLWTAWFAKSLLLSLWMSGSPESPL